MALGSLTKQFAAQALGSSIDNVLDRPAAPAQEDNLGSIILGQIQAMQNALKEDQELVVRFHSGTEHIRVLEVYMPSHRVFVLTGLDPEKNVTRIIAPVESIELICKIMKVQPEAKPVRIALVVPKPKAG